MNFSRSFGSYIRIRNDEIQLSYILANKNYMFDEKIHATCSGQNMIHNAALYNLVSEIQFEKLCSNSDRQVAAF